MSTFPVFSPLFGLSFVPRQSGGRELGSSWLMDERSLFRALCRCPSLSISKRRLRTPTGLPAISPRFETFTKNSPQFGAGWLAKWLSCESTQRGGRLFKGSSPPYILLLKRPLIRSLSHPKADFASLDVLGSAMSRSTPCSGHVSEHMKVRPPDSGLPRPKSSWIKSQVHPRAIASAEPG
jgi:hypothetical protein